jgi:hypothetical protein
MNRKFHVQKATNRYPTILRTSQAEAHHLIASTSFSNVPQDLQQTDSHRGTRKRQSDSGELGFDITCAKAVR